jgi:hypothetical protein
MMKIPIEEEKTRLEYSIQEYTKDVENWKVLYNLITYLMATVLI